MISGLLCFCRFAIPRTNPTNWTPSMALMSKLCVFGVEKASLQENWEKCSQPATSKLRDLHLCQLWFGPNLFLKRCTRWGLVAWPADLWLWRGGGGGGKVEAAWQPCAPAVSAYITITQTELSHYTIIHPKIRISWLEKSTNYLEFSSNTNTIKFSASF